MTGLLSYTRLNFVSDWYNPKTKTNRNLKFPLHLPVLTVSLAGSRPVIGAEPGLHLLLAQLELLGVGEQRPAGVPESLLLPGPILADVDRHPGGPGGVAAHLRAGLQVTGLILLENRKDDETATSVYSSAGFLRLPKDPKGSVIHYEQLAETHCC